MDDHKMKPKKLTYGAGVNDAGYAVAKYETIVVDGKKKKKQVWKCPFYRAWESMLSRCYSVKYQKRKPTYTGCTVAEDWLTFSVFKNWMRKQDYEGNHLDKDLLFPSNKIYSDKACVFITPMTNTFASDSGAARGKYLIGTCWHKKAGKFTAYCSNPIC